MSTTSSAETQPARDQELGSISWMWVVHGAFIVICGLLLIVIPGRTLTFVAVLAGLSLCAVGLLDIVRAFTERLTGGQRAAQIAIGLLALAAGAVVVARPDGSLRAIVVITGICLVVVGVLRTAFGSPGVDRRASLVYGVLAFVAGVVLLAWPDVTVGVLAAIYGVFLLAAGVVEMIFGFKARHAGDPA